MSISQNTLEMWELDCDKCCGTGKVLIMEDINELISRERQYLGIPSKHIALVAKIPYSSYCKFENGHVRFSSNRVRKIIEILNGWGKVPLNGGNLAECCDCGECGFCREVLLRGEGV